LEPDTTGGLSMIQNSDKTGKLPLGSTLINKLNKLILVYALNFMLK
jgi:hypothetical protein